MAAAPTQVAALGQGSGAQSVNVDLSSSGRQSGDWIVCIFHGDTADGWVAASGFTKKDEDLWSASTQSAVIFTKKSDGTEGASNNFTRSSGSTGTVKGVAMVIRGADPTNPFVGYTGIQRVTASSTFTSSSIATFVPGSFLIAWAASAATSTASGGEWTPPSGFTERTDQGGVTRNHATTATKTIASAGSQPGVSFSYANGSADGYVIFMALAEPYTQVSVSDIVAVQESEQSTKIMLATDGVAVQVVDGSGASQGSVDNMGIFLVELSSVGKLVAGSDPGGGTVGTAPPIVDPYTDYLQGKTGTYKDYNTNGDVS